MLSKYVWFYNIHKNCSKSILENVFNIKFSHLLDNLQDLMHNDRFYFSREITKVKREWKYIFIWEYYKNK